MPEGGGILGFREDCKIRLPKEDNIEPRHCAIYFKDD